MHTVYCVSNRFSMRYIYSVYSDRVKTYTLKDENPHAMRDNKNTPGQYDTWVLILIGHVRLLQGDRLVNQPIQRDGVKLG